MRRRTGIFVGGRLEDMKRLRKPLLGALLALAMSQAGLAQVEKVAARVQGQL